MPHSNDAPVVKTSATTSHLYLWKKRTLYIGRFEGPLDVSQGASTLSVSLTEPFSFQTTEMSEPMLCHSVLLPPGQTVCVDPKNAIVANCNLDALGRDHHALIPYASQKIGDIGFNLSNEDTLIDCFSIMFDAQMNSEDAFLHLESYLQTKEQANTKTLHIDPRIENIIDYIQDTVNDHITGEELAESVNLSIPRLAQLFKQQTGIPIRRYRLWHRLYLTAQHVGKGKNLTDAAIAAGFTDSSHFAHTFRSMLGMTPSYILSQVNKTRIVIQ